MLFVHDFDRQVQIFIIFIQFFIFIFSMVINLKIEEGEV